MVNITFEFPLLQTDQSQVIVARLKKQVFLDFNVVKINIAKIIKLTDRNNYLWLVAYWFMIMVNITFVSQLLHTDQSFVAYLNKEGFYFISTRL